VYRFLLLHAEKKNIEAVHLRMASTLEWNLPNSLSCKSIVGGFNPSEKYEFVSWDSYPQYMESHKIPWFQATNQKSIVARQI